MKSMNQNSFLQHLNNFQSEENLQVDLQKIYSQYQSFMDCQDETDHQQIFVSTLDLSSINNLHSPCLNTNQSLLQQNKNKNTQLDLFRKIIHQLVRQNLGFKKQLSQQKETLQDVIIYIQNNLASKVKNFTYFSSLFQEQTVLNMTKYIKNTVQKIKENQKQNQNYLFSIKMLKVENLELHIKNQQLNKFIKQRKQYSQKLKQIIKVKQKQVEDIKKSMQNELKFLQSLNHIQTNCDLKYRNRNDLIIMIKSLINQMLRHDKDCKIMQNKIPAQNIDKFLIKSVELKKKPSITE